MNRNSVSLARGRRLEVRRGGRAAAPRAASGGAAPLVDPEAVRGARLALPSPADIEALGALFKLVGDPTRLAILHALGASPLCVGDLGAVVGLSESAVSHQLALLRHARLVAAHRSGRAVYYRLGDRHVRSIVAAARVHLGEEG